MAEALGVVSSVIAVVDLSAKVFSLCLQYSREVKNAKDDIKRLRVEVATFQVTTKKLQILVEEPRGKELSASQQLKSAIEDGRSRLEKLEQQLQPPTHRKVMSRFGARAFKWPFECKDVEGTIQNLVRCRENISLALNIDQTVILQNVDDRTTLSQLPAADGASFDSHAEEHNPTCLPNTREELLREIDHWINDPNSKIMFWLNGKAGTGKSTISRTVARSRCKQGDLGASFFFKRGEVDRGNLSKFVSTVARRLAWSTPVVAPFIKSAVNADPAITDKAVREQFEKLVREPLSKATVKLLSRPSVVIVVDALDECEKDADIKLLLELFSTLCFAGPLRVRVLVTSRPELPIRLGFSSIGNTHQDLILHKIPLPIIEHDISVFLHHEFANIRNSFNKDAVEELKLPVDWPGEAKLEELTRAAVPLFIFAATLCRFISDPYLGSPDELLQSVLDVAGTGQGSKLDMTYSPVLRQQVLNRSGSERLDIIESFRLIVGSIVTLANPLSMRALALLLDVHTQGDPELSDENEAYGFLTTHFLHWLEALSLMGRVKECLDSLRSLARWLKTREDSRLSTFVADAIRFVQAYFSVIAEAPLQIYCCLAFAPRKSIIRRTFENVIPKWISNLPKVEENWDACLLTLEGHIRAVNSVVFSHDSKRVASGSDDETIRIWDAETGECEQELKGHSGMVTSVVFSHDSKKVASGSDDEMIRIWDAETGECERELKGHSGMVTSVVFSHDSKRVASASSDKAIRIWNAETGECERVLKSHSSLVNSVVFSHDSKKVASASRDEIIRIWDAETGECERELKGHSDWVNSVVFSHDSKKVASGSDDEMIRIWDAETGECERELKGHSGMVNSVVFSHDSKKVASGSDDKMIRIWDAETGKCEQELKGHSGIVTSVVFSHDSKKVASASRDEIIRIWDAETGECEQVLKGHSDWVNSVVFSHDSKKVASGSHDETIRIWNAETGECKEIVPLDGYARVSSFPTDRRGIVTNRGVFALSGGSLPHAEPAMLQQSSEAPMLACADGTWITTAGEDLLWLPPECRSGEVAVSGSTVVVGCQSGRVLVLGISMAEVEQ
ncbi:Vegetative incompatibility protein HET-E-1 [Fusarium oxysporum f. sp. rapae]|uniref:Vegetative incompatibility protein HET-E-1 n=1 Tax=Fusarium oxysporum f. sp. rapae TaxID=485398 RepID=A0A8J5P1J6_FUSOX|nr:Vegetative incompatibility protein HET-E-1 [Fusarium oxysporum f. sp. rapae]